MIIDTTFARELAADLLEINAVILRPNEPFTWASGWHSPIYCDNRLTLRQPHIRSKIAAKFSEFITKEFPDIDVVTGTATAGIPHAAWVADKVNKPMAYVRAKPKSYGMGNQIEGGVAKGEKNRSNRRFGLHRRFCYFGNQCLTICRCRCSSYHIHF